MNIHFTHIYPFFKQLQILYWKVKAWDICVNNLYPDISGVNQKYLVGFSQKFSNKLVVNDFNPHQSILRGSELLIYTIYICD